MVLGRNLQARTAVTLPPETPPILMAVIDTEEEFDWNRPFDRDATGVTAIDELWRAQAVFEEFGIKPVYVIDFPVASTPSSAAVLADLHARNVAVVGMHLHPWVSPPHEEDVSSHNSYQGNLDPSLERRKLEVLRDAIVANVGINPDIHKAGRYGFGWHTAEHLLELGVEIDLSAAPGYDFRNDGGPDYAALDAHLYTFGPDERLFGIPTTGGFMGPLRELGPKLYSAPAQSSTHTSLLASVLSKARLAERIMMSPEGHSLDKMKRMTRALLKRGVRVITFSFHSPTVKPGCTPYTQSEAAVTDFLDQCRQYFEFFMDELGGVTQTPHDIKRQALTLTSASNV